MVAVIIQFVGSLERRCMLKVGIKFLILLGMVVGSSGLSACSFDSSSSSVDFSSDEDPSAISCSSDASAAVVAGEVLASGTDDPFILSDFVTYNKDYFADEKGQKALDLLTQYGERLKQALYNLHSEYLSCPSPDPLEEKLIHFSIAHFIINKLNALLFAIYKDDFFQEEQKAVAEFFANRQGLLSVICDISVGTYEVSDFLTPSSAAMFSYFKQVRNGEAGIQELTIMSSLDMCFFLFHSIHFFAKDGLFQLQFQQRQPVLVLNEKAGRFSFELLPKKNCTMPPAKLREEIDRFAKKLLRISFFNAVSLFYFNNDPIGTFFQKLDLKKGDEPFSFTAFEKAASTSVFYRDFQDFNRDNILSISSWFFE